MQICLTLIGKVKLKDPTTKVGAAPSIPFFTLCGGDGSRVAKIQVEATSLLAKAAAEEMC